MQGWLLSHAPRSLHVRSGTRTADPERQSGARWRAGHAQRSLESKCNQFVDRYGSTSGNVGRRQCYAVVAMLLVGWCDSYSLTNPKLCRAVCDDSCVGATYVCGCDVRVPLSALSHNTHAHVRTGTLDTTHSNQYRRAASRQPCTF